MGKDKLNRMLKAARTEKGYNQASLAKQLKVTQATISHWDNNIAGAKFGDVIKLCKLLELDITELAKEV